MRRGTAILEHARQRLAALPPAVFVVAAWLVAVAYAFPGYMNYDSADQLWQARTGNVVDWHPAIMVRYWQLVEMLVHGPFGMLVIQLSLFTLGIHALLRQRVAPRAAAIATAMLVLFPPILTPMAVVWKDGQMAGLALAGFALALRPSRRARIAGVAMLVLATAVRDNAIAAMPPLCLVIAARWGVQRRRAVVAVAAALVVGMAGVATLANYLSFTTRSYAWYRSNAIHDIAGALCNDPPMTDPEIRDELVGIPLQVDSDLHRKLCAQYNTRWWFPLSLGDDRIFKTVPDKAERLARRDAWFRVVRDHTWAWLVHRAAVMEELLGLTEPGTEEPVCQTFTANARQLARVQHDASLSWFQDHAGMLFVALAGTVLFRPWLYLLVGLTLLGYAYRKRDGLLAALVASGTCYEAGFFLGAAGPAYRYSHWMIACACVAAAMALCERLVTRGVVSSNELR